MTNNSNSSIFSVLSSNEKPDPAEEAWIKEVQDRVDGVETDLNEKREPNDK